MRVSDKLSLIDEIGKELQWRYDYDEIDAYLFEYKILKPSGSNFENKSSYAKKALFGASSELITDIAKDLDIKIIDINREILSEPKNWQNTNDFRLFISHISNDKDKAKRLKDCLSIHYISGFVAHEDIQPTLSWQTEIERALNTMDAFVAVHTLGFSKSVWTQQEIGFAVARRVKIISVKMGEDPTGFISKSQALTRKQRTAEEIASEINGLLLADEDTAEKIRAAKKAADLSNALDKIPF
jgi:TIR domain